MTIGETSPNPAPGAHLWGGPSDDEKALLRQLTLCPDSPAAHYHYALFLANQHRGAEAVPHYQEALRLQPRYSEALRNFAALLVAERRFEEAVGHLWAAVAIRPDDVQALNALGNALVSAKRPEEALPLLLHAARLLPGDGHIYNNLGLAYGDCGRFAEAEEAFATALHHGTMSVEAHNNLACLYIMMGRHREALSCLGLALVLDPQHRSARRNRALAHLALGEFERGWEDYDWCAFGVAQPPDPFPRWNGEPVARRRIVLTAHQGLGDTLQFVRYATLLKALRAYIILECPGPLVEVLAHVDGVDEIVPQGAPLPPADLSVPLMALARLFKTTLATIPAAVPYISASSERSAAWRARLAPRGGPGELLVGISWQGNPNHQWDRFRSVRLMALEPLTRIPGVRLLSLQRGPGVEQIDGFQRLTNQALCVPTNGQQDTPEDLADSAALMSLVDLVITVDTATAHLAGAMARPVWVALSRAADWRWLTDRCDTPWYPSMRLFRQRNAGEWDEVLSHIAANLVARAHSV